MELVDHKKVAQEFKDRFKRMSSDELIGAFNREVGNTGWTTSRAIYLNALREEIESRGYDYSEIGSSSGWSYRRKVKLIGNRIIIDETYV